MWDWAIWGALGVVVVAGSVAVWRLIAGVRAAGRALAAARAHAVNTLDDFATKAEAAEAKVKTAADTAELKASLARLRASLAQLAVLRTALDELESAAGWVKALAPLFL